MKLSNAIPQYVRKQNCINCNCKYLPLMHMHIHSMQIFAEWLHTDFNSFQQHSLRNIVENFPFCKSTISSWAPSTMPKTIPKHQSTSLAITLGRCTLFNTEKQDKLLPEAIFNPRPPPTAVLARDDPHEMEIKEQPPNQPPHNYLIVNIFNFAPLEDSAQFSGI